jgi:hypothetical protein
LHVCGSGHEGRRREGKVEVEGLDLRDDELRWGEREAGWLCHRGHVGGGMRDEGDVGIRADNWARRLRVCRRQHRGSRSAEGRFLCLVFRTNFLIEPDVSPWPVERIRYRRLPPAQCSQLFVVVLVVVAVVFLRRKSRTA